VHRAPLSYPLRDGDTVTGRQAADRAIAHIEANIGAHDRAALVIEPIQGESGFIQEWMYYRHRLHVAFPIRGWWPTC